MSIFLKWQFYPTRLSYLSLQARGSVVAELLRGASLNVFELFTILTSLPMTTPSICTFEWFTSMESSPC